MFAFFTYRIFISFIFVLIVADVFAQHPRLLFYADDIADLKEKAQSESGKPIIAQLQRRLSEDPDPLWVGSYTAGHALMFLLQVDSAYYQLSKEFALSTINDSIPFISTGQKYQGSLSIPLWNSQYKSIYRIPNLVGLALTYDFMYSSWPETFRQ